MTRYGMVVSTSRCIGCRTCSTACKMEHTLPLGTFRMRVLNARGEIAYDAYEGTYPNVSLSWTPSACQHCDNPPCLEVCPTGATQKREDGIVYVQSDDCIGCGSCEQACPYDARSLDSETNVMEKCTLCMERLDEGKTPMCELCCPARAIHVGDLDDEQSEVSQLLASKETVQLLAEENTGPRTYYW